MPKRKIPVADLASDDDQEFEASDSSDAPVTKACHMQDTIDNIN